MVNVRVSLLLEAATAGFYISITRGLLIPLLTFRGYDIAEIAQLLIAPGVVGVALANYIYRRPTTLMGSGWLLPATHLLERVSFMALPLVSGNGALLAAVYMAGVLLSIVVGVLLTALIFSSFDEEGLGSVLSQRAALGSVSTLIGGMVAFAYVATVETFTAYIDLYILAGLIGSLGTLGLVGVRIGGVPTEAAYPAHVEVGRVNTFVYLFLIYAGGNLVGYVWVPLLRGWGYEDFLIVLVTVIAASVGGIFGAFVWRSPAHYKAAALLNALFTGLVPLFHTSYMQLALSLAMSVTFVGMNLLGSVIYSRYQASIGTIRASVLVIGANMSGQVFGTALGILYPDPIALFVAAAAIKASAAITALTAIPGVSGTEAGRAVGYARLVYTVGTLGYTFVVETYRQTLELLVKSVAITLLIMLIYMIYRLAFALLGI